MPTVEDRVNKELGIDTNLSVWQDVEARVDAELGIKSEALTFEEQRARMKDVLHLADKYELPVETAKAEYDEIKRQERENPFGTLQPGKTEFSVRKMFKNLWHKVKPPPLGEASPDQIYWGLVDGVKGAGHIGVEYATGRYTLGLADTLVQPAQAFRDVYLANRKLKADLESKGWEVKDVGTKHDPVWRIWNKEGVTEFIEPNTVYNTKLANSVAELYDLLVGLDVPPEGKTMGEIAKTIGAFRGAHALKTAAKGPVSLRMGALGRAGEAAQVGLIFGTAQELSYGLRGDENYRGAIGVLEDAVVLAGLSLIGSGIGGIWKKLTPTEHQKALKVLGLKKGATEQQVKAAARKRFLQYHPDKVKGMQAEFQKAVEARNILLNPNYGRDIVYRGRAPSTAKLLAEARMPEGAKEAIIPKPPKPPIKIEPEPIVLAKPAPTAEAAEKPAAKEELLLSAKLDKADIAFPPVGIYGEGKLPLGMWPTDKKVWGKKVTPEEFLKRFARTVPEFTVNPIFIVSENKQLTYIQFGERFTFEPKAFGIEPEQLGVGQKIRVDLESYGIKLASKAALKKAARLPFVDLPLDNKELDQLMKNMRPGFVDIEPYVESIRRAHDWVFTFAEAKRMEGLKSWALGMFGEGKEPELFTKLMESYGKRNAAVEKAISVLKSVVPQNLSYDEARELAFAYEDKTMSAPEGLEEAYEGFASILDKIEKKGIAEGLFKETFQERMIAENELRIQALTEKLQHPSKSKQIQELVAENERLKDIRYLPHTVVARRTIEEKLAQLDVPKRKTFLDSLARISAKYKKRKGKLFLREYVEEGILDPEDVDIRKLTAEALTGYYYRSALKSLFDYANEEGLIKPVSDALRKEGWLNQQEIGITSPELKEKLVHPLLASSLAEMKEMKLGKGGGTMRQVLGMVKIGQFIKPTIIYTYNAIQKFMKGMYSLDPTKEARFLAQAMHSVVGKDALYHKLNESNLYQFPYEISRGSVEEQIEQYVRQNAKEIGSLTKLLEKTTDTTWKAKDLDLKKMIMVGHRALANATWLGDKVQRTQSYLVLRDMGYPHNEAVAVASKSHGAYSVLSEKYKKTLSPILFVYSFRVLMPIEIAKIMTEPLINMGQAFYTKEPIPKHKWNRWVKAWVGASAIVVLTDSYMQMRGFKKTGKHLGPLAWKWKKTVEVDGEEKEIVVGINNILNMPVKYWNRITYYNPIKPKARWQQAIEHTVKWELHPLWRIFFWDIKENRKSFGTGLRVYDPNAHPIEQFGQSIGYVFGQAFRFWGGMMDAVGEGKMSDKERKEQKKIFDAGLNKLDKFLFTVFGYKYIRLPKEDRQAISARQLQKEFKRRAFEEGRRYEGDELDRRLDSLGKWAERCERWIEKME